MEEDCLVHDLLELGVLQIVPHHHLQHLLSRIGYQKSARAQKVQVPSVANLDNF
jgi:hypothetical protein